MGKMINCI